MTSAFVYLRPKALLFVRAVGPRTIAAQQAWKRMFDWMDEKGVSSDGLVGYGLSRLDGETIRYDACLEFTPPLEPLLDADFRTQTLPGGSYARRPHRGSHAGLGDALRNLRDEWISERNLTVDTERPMIEIYLNDPRKVPARELRTEVCLPVKVTQGIRAA